MKLTKNEKKVLNLLLINARISDSSIAKKLKISSQAVGKIRKKLEISIIDSYSTNLNYGKLGIKTFAIALAKLTAEGMDKGELEIERKLLNESNIINVYRVPNQNITHIILYGFMNINDLDEFFHSIKKKQELYKYIENKDLFTFSDHSLIKINPSQLLKSALEYKDSEIESSRNLIELENFKKKLNQKNEA